MNDWIDKFKNQSFFYVTPDVKRGLGLESILPNYHIICSFSDPLIPVLRKQNAKIFCLDATIHNSGKLLEDSQVNDYIKKNSIGTPNILLFKPSIKSEILCTSKGYRLLVNSAKLNRQNENKISFHELVFNNLPKFSISSLTGYLKDFNFVSLVKQFNLPFVIQFALGWGGLTTFLIKEENDYTLLINRFPETPVKISKYIKGFTVLNNACLYQDKILVSPPAFQISGFKELSLNPNVTCGRQWPCEFLTNLNRKTIDDLTLKVGKIMAKNGYKGFFGLDFIVELESGKVYLSENNARFTASTPFWTKLELGQKVVPLIIYHLAAFTGVSLNSHYQVNPDTYGSQIIFREGAKQPSFAKEIDFGVLKSVNKNWKMVRRDYQIEKLGLDEFIYMKRSGRPGGDTEISRIETKREVVQTISRLQDWVSPFL